MKNNGSACLADFGLMSIVLDPETTDITSSTGESAKGTYRWMGPELFYPSEFGLPKFQLTKESDCYAFGMVIYEVGSSQSGGQYFAYRFHPRGVGSLREDPPQRAQTFVAGAARGIKRDSSGYPRRYSSELGGALEHCTRVLEPKSLGSTILPNGS